MTLPQEPPGWGPVVITAREVYDVVRQLDSSVRSMVQSLGQLLDERAKRDEEIDKRFDDHEDRLRAMESNRWPVAPLVLLTSVIGVGLAIWSLLKN